MRATPLEKVTASDLLFEVVKYVVLVGFALACIVPVFNMLAISFSSSAAYYSHPNMLFPREFTTSVYRTIFRSQLLLRSLLNSAYITVTGTALSIVLTSSFAYVLSRKNMLGNSQLNFFVFFFMLFGGSLIPKYILMRELGLLNTYWAVILSTAINPFWVIMMRNFFESISEEIFESAHMEGASELRIWYSIAVPLSKAATATFVLFYAVRHWNDFFQSLMFLSSPRKWPVQVWLQTMLYDADMMMAEAGQAPEEAVVPEAMRMGTTFFAMAPIVCVYPFLQKHFAKGVTLGSIKG